MTSSRMFASRRRGYLLLEAMLGGAILAVILSVSLSMIGGARASASLGSKRQVAAALARAKLEELQAKNPIVLTPQPLSPIAGYPALRLGHTVTNVTTTYDADSPEGIDGTIFEIVVEVEYPTSTGPQTLTLRTLRRDG